MACGLARPKERAKNWVVPEASGLSVTETESNEKRLERAGYIVWSIKSRWEQLLENPDGAALNARLTPFQPVGSSKHSKLRPRLITNSACSWHTYSHKLLSLLLEDRWILQTRRAIRFALGILVGLLIGGVSGYWLVMNPNLVIKENQASSSYHSQFFFSISIWSNWLHRRCGSRFQLEAIDIEQLPVFDWEEIVGETHRKDDSVLWREEKPVQWVGINKKINMRIYRTWGVIIKRRSKRPTLRKEKNSTSSLNLINFSRKNLSVEDNFADGFKVKQWDQCRRNLIQREILEKYSDRVSLSIHVSVNSGTKVEMVMDFQRKWGLCGPSFIIKWGFPFEQ